MLKFADSVAAVLKRIIYFCGLLIILLVCIGLILVTRGWFCLVLASFVLVYVAVQIAKAKTSK